MSVESAKAFLGALAVIRMTWEPGVMHPPFTDALRTTTVISRLGLARMLGGNNLSYQFSGIVSGGNLPVI